MGKLREFMQGRYGPDQLNLTLLVFSLVLSIVFRFIMMPWFLYLIVYIPLGFAIFRMLSTNIPKRARENVKFLNIWYRIKRFPKTVQQRFADRKVYKFTRCPDCKQKIRLPKGKGKLRVDCPSCHHTFDQKT